MSSPAHPDTAEAQSASSPLKLVIDATARCHPMRSHEPCRHYAGTSALSVFAMDQDNSTNTKCFGDKRHSGLKQRQETLTLVVIDRHTVVRYSLRLNATRQ
eukprot:1555570-Amphidinium_carterae.1